MNGEFRALDLAHSRDIALIRTCGGPTEASKSCCANPWRNNPRRSTRGESRTRRAANLRPYRGPRRGRRDEHARLADKSEACLPQCAATPSPSGRWSRSSMSNGRFGRRVVEMTVLAGPVLSAVTIIVPGMPIGLTLVDVPLLSAGVSTAALTTEASPRRIAPRRMRSRRLPRAWEHAREEASAAASAGRRRMTPPRGLWSIRVCRRPRPCRPSERLRAAMRRPSRRPRTARTTPTRRGWAGRPGEAVIADVDAIDHEGDAGQHGRRRGQRGSARERATAIPIRTAVRPKAIR